MRLIFCLIVLFSGVASASYKVAVVDIGLAVQETSDGRTAQKRLTNEFMLLEDKLKKREFSLFEKVENFEKKAMILSKTKREKQRVEIQKLTLDFQKDMRQFQASLQKKQIEATQPIIEKLEEQIAILAKEKGYDVVFNKTKNNVLWAKEAIDVTNTIVTMYEKSG